jgi:glycosyltransferase involved in cell wall biosynthesis
MARGKLVSVIVPTYRRPRTLARAVASVLGQELPPGTELEVVVAVSDPGSDADVTAADELAADRRCRVVIAPRPGPAAARNAALAEARGEVVAFIDDDCVADPGWIRAGLDALESADLVQGRTVPDGVMGGYDDSLVIDPPSWLWESCNLFVRREVMDRAGGFDESWNPTGRDGDHWGEDTVLGWKMLRGGARAGFSNMAIVRHEVRPRTFRQWAAHNSRLRYFPQLVRAAPEARRRFYLGYFIDKRHAVVVGCVVTLAAAAAARGSGRPRAAKGLAALAGTVYVRRTMAPAVTNLVKYRVPQDAVELAAAIYGSIRHRRVVL